MQVRKWVQSGIESDGCTFSIRSKDNRERDNAACLDDPVALIDPSSNDIPEWRNFRANRPTTLYTTTNQYVPSFLLEKNRLSTDLSTGVQPRTKTGPIAGNQDSMGTSGGSRAELDAGRAPEVLRVGLQRAVLPDDADRLQTKRGGRSAVPEGDNAVDVEFDRVGAAARRVDRGYFRSVDRAVGVIRSGLGGC